MRNYRLATQNGLSAQPPALSSPNEAKTKPSPPHILLLSTRIITLILVLFSFALVLVTLLLPSASSQLSILTIQPSGTQLAKTVDVPTFGNDSSPWIDDNMDGLGGNLADDSNSTDAGIFTDGANLTDAAGLDGFGDNSTDVNDGMFGGNVTDDGDGMDLFEGNSTDTDERMDDDDIDGMKGMRKRAVWDGLSGPSLWVGVACEFASAFLTRQV